MGCHIVQIAGSVIVGLEHGIEVHAKGLCLVEQRGKVRTALVNALLGGQGIGVQSQGLAGLHDIFALSAGLHIHDGHQPGLVVLDAIPGGVVGNHRFMVHRFAFWRNEGIGVMDKELFQCMESGDCDQHDQQQGGQSVPAQAAPDADPGCTAVRQWRQLF